MVIVALGQRQEARLASYLYKAEKERRPSETAIKATMDGIIAKLQFAHKEASADVR